MICRRRTAALSDRFYSLFAETLSEGLTYRFLYIFYDADGVSLASGDDKTFIATSIPTVWLCDKKSFRILHTALDTVDVCNFPKMADSVITCYEPAMRPMED